MEREERRTLTFHLVELWSVRKSTSEIEEPCALEISREVGGGGPP